MATRTLPILVELKGSEIVKGEPKPDGTGNYSDHWIVDLVTLVMKKSTQRRKIKIAEETVEFRSNVEPPKSPGKYYAFLTVANTKSGGLWDFIEHFEKA